MPSVTEAPGEITVLGGGIAGLAVSLALARQGRSVRVLEQAPAIGEVGAGLQVSPNGAAVLQALGLGDELAAAGVPAQAVELRDGHDGRLVLKLDLAGAGHRGGYHFVHRADLIGLLERAARDAGVEIHTGCQAVLVTSTRDAAEIALRDGRVIRTGLLLGADGLRSVVRETLNLPPRPLFTGQVAWRAVITEATPGPAVAQVFMGPGRHLVSYPLRGGRQRNLVAVEERREWTAEGWQQRDDPAHLRRVFARFGGPVPEWLARVEETHLWGLFRHEVAARWHEGRCAVLGDAAHAMLPFMAQGANMALEDAWVLARALAEGSGIDGAFASYQALRLQRVRRVVAATQGNARAYHLGGPLKLAAHAALRLAGALAPGAALARYDWLYRHDVTGGAGMAEVSS